MSRPGKQNSRSYLSDEIRQTLEVKALLIELNQRRIEVKRIAWETGNKRLFEQAEAMKKALIKIKKIHSRYWHELNIQLDDD
jgi:hypothetical protein